MKLLLKLTTPIYIGVIIDNKLTFNEHVSKICKKASNKLHALAGISKYMTKNKLRTYNECLFFFSFRILPLNLGVPQSNTEQQNT